MDLRSLLRLRAHQRGVHDLSRRRRGGLALALCLLAAGSLLAAWRALPDRLPWPEADEMRVKLLAGLAVMALVGAAELLRAAPRLSLGALAAAAALAAAHYTNFGHLHYPRLPHLGEQFHYALGARYFGELGYDGLYLASLAAQREAEPARPVQESIRDLRSNALVPTASLAGEEARVRGRFSPERWRAFRADHAFFLRALPAAAMDGFRRDHGYNPTPAWTAVARLAMAGLPIGGRSLALFASFDLWLLAGLFLALGRAFGARAALLCGVLFGTGYLGRFSWTGGALLRHDWIAAAGLAACLLARGRAALAGACLGYAAAVRLFPAALLFGPAVVALRQLLAGERPRWALALALGFAGAVTLALLAGAAAGRGPAAWPELVRRMHVYQLSGGRNLVGLESVVLYGSDALERALAPPADGAPWDLRREDVSLRRHARAPALLAARAGLLLLLAAAAWRARPERGLVLSCAAVFAAVAPAGYYWSLLCLAPVAVGSGAVFAQLGVDLLLHALHPVIPDGLVRSALAAWALLALFALWLLPAAVRSLCGRSSGPETPTLPLR